MDRRGALDGGVGAIIGCFVLIVQLYSARSQIVNLRRNADRDVGVPRNHKTCPCGVYNFKSPEVQMRKDSPNYFASIETLYRDCDEFEHQNQQSLRHCPLHLEID